MAEVRTGGKIWRNEGQFREPILALATPQPTGQPAYTELISASRAVKLADIRYSRYDR